MPVQRRDFLVAALGAAGGLTAGLWGSRFAPGTAQAASPLQGTPAESETDEKLTADQALQRLLAGNQRFVESRTLRPRQSAERRKKVAAGQHPIAIVFGCADSRVPPEVIFDQGLGDLFVVREAGQVAEEATLASMEYAIEHLHAPLLMVLGHSKCGAVQAAADVVLKGSKPPGHLTRLTEAIKPAVEKVRGMEGDLLALAVKENVRRIVGQLGTSQPVLAESIQQKHVRIVGAHYDLQTGRVELV
jgi:carbonic anhydrase